MALNLAAGADLHALLDLHERPDQRLVADRAAVEVDEREDLDVLAQPDVGGDAAGERVAAFGAPPPGHHAPPTAAPIAPVSPPSPIDFFAPSRIPPTPPP